MATVAIDNVSDASFVLMNEGNVSFHKRNDLVVLEPHTTTHVEVKTRTWEAEFQLRFHVLNALTSPKTHPTIVLTVRAQ